MSKFTPGPWDNNSRKTVVRQTVSAEWLADVGGRDTLEAIANARLIAAAPDQYEELKRTLVDFRALANSTDSRSTERFADESADRIQALLTKIDGE